VQRGPCRGIRGVILEDHVEAAGAELFGDLTASLDTNPRVVERDIVFGHQHHCHAPARPRGVHD
jgi:hypothetical protein